MSGRWEPSPQDAMSLAALRWFANSIENFAIELYATDRASFEAIETVLRGTLKELKGVRKRPLGEEDGCPDGFVNCHGVCAPSCEMEADLMSAPPARPVGSGKKKGKKR